MRRRLFLLASLLIVFAEQSAFTQAGARIAVLPFSAVETSESEARVVTSLFETALVKTGVYSVIEQNQIKEILEAQAFSLSGCVDDACALEVGELLSAELIILGEFSRVGGRYIANAKIIDVGLGKNVNADSVTAGSIAEMTDDAAPLLAYKLAGMTYMGSSGERIAEAFGEIFISTVPDEADIFINGMRRGKSPILVDKIPMGEVRITARKENLAGEEVVTLSTADLAEITIELEEAFGRMFIKSSVKDMVVYLDGKDIGPIGSGLFRDLPLGKHNLTLKGNWFIWEETIYLEANKTINIDAYPVPYGILEYILPENEICEISAEGFHETLAGSGNLELKIGSYLCRVSGNEGNKFEQKVKIEKGKLARMSSEQVLTEEYGEYSPEQERNSTKKGFENMAAILEYNLTKKNIAEGDISKTLEEARRLFSDVERSEYVFPDLKERSKDIFIKAIILRIDELDALIELSEKSKGTLTAGKWISFGLGAASLAVSGAFKIIGDLEYENYLAATNTAEAEASHSRLSGYSALQIVGIAGGIAGAAVGTFFFNPEDENKYSIEISALSAERARIEGGIK